MSARVSTSSPEIPVCSGNRRLINQADVTAWNGMIQTGVDTLTVPPPEALDPTPGEIYWDKADIRIMLNLNLATPVAEVRRPDGTVSGRQHTGGSAPRQQMRKDVAQGPETE